MSVEHQTTLERIKQKDLLQLTVSLFLQPFPLIRINTKLIDNDNYLTLLEMTEQEKVEYEKLKASGLQAAVDDEEKKVIKKEQEKKAKEEKKEEKKK